MCWCNCVPLFQILQTSNSQWHSHPPPAFIDEIPRAIINSHYSQKKLNKQNVQCVTEHSWWARLMGGHVMMLPWCLWVIIITFDIWISQKSDITGRPFFRRWIFIIICVLSRAQSSHANEAKIMQITSQHWVTRSQSEASIKTRWPIRRRETPHNFGLVTPCDVMQDSHAVSREAWQCHEDVTMSTLALTSWGAWHRASLDSLDTDGHCLPSMAWWQPHAQVSLIGLAQQ